MKNTLQENMRRFATKNLNEQIDGDANNNGYPDKTEKYFSHSNILQNSEMFPSQMEALIGGFRGSLDALIAIVEELKSNDPEWDTELRLLGAMKDMQSKSQLFRSVPVGKSFNANDWNSATRYAKNYLPRKKK
jgi:hypothetical protein